ncbi:MAG: signal peptidase I [Gordonia sp. (in: high G+C Gram-positive bacteria)]|uniref:signal peptidase I n=1 Tax=Gordonia sp. (in: high G+C Gram-positive bacteria) TaxID=84139 RepID=UPI003C78FDA2
MTTPTSETSGTETPGTDAVERTPRQRAMHILWQTVSWFLLAAAFAMLCTTILIPKIAGARPYTVLTGSMKPDYPAGSLVVVKPRTVSSIHVGDVITYQIESGKADVVTHRVIEVQEGPDQQPRFITKGDNNNVPDAEPVRPIQVRGVLWYSVPYLGFVNTWFTGAKRTIIVFVLAGLLFVYGGWQFYVDWRDGRRAEAEGTDETTVPEPDNTDTAPLRTEVES